MCKNRSANRSMPSPYSAGSLGRMWQTAAMRIHLIRHGEVYNPDHVVYANLAGFTLSDLGRSQALSTGRYLAESPITQIVTSPLERAVDTSALLTAAIGGVPIDVDDRLTEWDLSTRWAGVRWEELNHLFPGELDRYLTDPYDLPFAPESLAEVAHRMLAAVRTWTASATGDVVFVSHQDPVHSGRLQLTGTIAVDYHSEKPEHSSVSTLARDDSGWAMVDYWAPPQHA